MKKFLYQLIDESATEQLGLLLSEVLPDRAMVALSGTMGAGKTRLVQAIARASGVAADDVVSPTFVLINEYQGRRPIFHFDAYRLRDDDEFLALGPEEYFAAEGWTFVEWAERVRACLPAERLEIVLEITGPTTRQVEVKSLSVDYHQVLDQLRGRLLADGRREQNET